ncbi:hypothetical protein SVAN01_06919 [Stagonosporopsis vannaccii]|nr:hypothetical protein SVAN01_06919 [Stagonosporopsis vannaccii]
MGIDTSQQPVRVVSGLTEKGSIRQQLETLAADEAGQGTHARRFDCGESMIHSGEDGSKQDRRKQDCSRIRSGAHNTDLGIIRGQQPLPNDALERDGLSAVTVVWQGHETRPYQIHVVPRAAQSCACRPYVCWRAANAIRYAEASRKTPCAKRATHDALRLGGPSAEPTTWTWHRAAANGAPAASSAPTEPVLGRLPLWGACMRPSAHRNLRRRAACAMMHARRNQ